MDGGLVEDRRARIPGPRSVMPVVIAAVVSSLAALEFFAQGPPWKRVNRFHVFAARPSLARQIAKRRYPLTTSQYEAVFDAVVRVSLPVKNVFASQEMVELVAAVPAVVKAMADVPSLAAALRSDAAGAAPRSGI